MRHRSSGFRATPAIPKKKSRNFQPSLKACFDVRPLVVEDREHHGVSNEPIGLDPVLALRTLVLGAELADGGLAVEISPIRLELNPDGAELFERVA